MLGIFVLGLALGSLSIRGHKLSVVYLFKQLRNAVLLSLIIYLTVPFWPYWASTIKVSLASLPSNFYVFLFLIILFTALFLVPFLLFMGRLLPLGYALADKSQHNYGRVCGSIYFCNTLGTVFGALVLGYVFLRLFSVDQIYKINVGLILVVTAYFLFRQNYKKGFVCALLALMVLAVIPSWNRNSHAVGLFRVNKPEPYHFKSLFHTPIFTFFTLLFMEDGPNTTVSVLASKTGHHRTILVNGKSDSNTSLDYSTLTFLASVPYFFAPEGKMLKASIVGLGTGMTAGLLGLGREIEEVDVLEISDTVIKASPYFAEYNYGYSTNPKIHIHEIDAFKYFAKLETPVDIVISEPSNPWVVGAENLFTIEFYKLVRKSLTPEGVFFQWVQLYEMNDDVFYAILDNMAEVFNHVKIIQTLQGDVGILASVGNDLQQPIAGRFWEEEMLKAHQKLGLEELKYLPLITLYNNETVQWLRLKNKMGFHDVETPKIGYLTAKDQFLGTNLDPFSLTHSSGSSRWLNGNAQNLLIKKELISDWDEDSPSCKTMNRENGFICNAFKEIKEHLKRVEGSFDRGRNLASYRLLRDRGLYPQDFEFLARTKEHFFQKGLAMLLEERVAGVQELAMEYTLEQEYPIAGTIINQAREEGLFSEEEAKKFNDSLSSLAGELKIQVEAYHKILQ